MASRGDRKEQIFFLDLGEGLTRLHSVFNHKTYHEIIKKKKAPPLSCPTWFMPKGTAKMLLSIKPKGPPPLGPGSMVLLVQPGKKFLDQLEADEAGKGARALAGQEEHKGGGRIGEAGQEDEDGTEMGSEHDEEGDDDEGGGQGMEMDVEVEAPEGAGGEAPGGAAGEDVAGVEAAGLDAPASGPEAAAEWRRRYGGLQVIIGVARVAAVQHDTERCAQLFDLHRRKNADNEFSHLVEFEDVVPVALPLVQLAYDVGLFNKKGELKTLKGSRHERKGLAEGFQLAFDHYVATGQQLLECARAHRLAPAGSGSAAQQALRPLPSPAAAFPPFPGGGYQGFLRRQEEMGQAAGEGQGHVGAMKEEEEEDDLELGWPPEHPERMAEGRTSGRCDGANPGGDESDDGESSDGGSTDDSGYGRGATEDMDGGDGAGSDDFGGGSINDGDSGGTGGGGSPRMPSNHPDPAGASGAAWREGTATSDGHHGGFVDAEEASHESDTDTGAGGGTDAGEGAGTGAPPQHPRKRRSEGATPPAQRQRQADDARRPSSVAKVLGPFHPASPPVAAAAAASGAEHACPSTPGMPSPGGAGGGSALPAAAANPVGVAAPAPERAEGTDTPPQQPRQPVQSPPPPPRPPVAAGSGGSSGGSGLGAAVAALLDAQAPPGPAHGAGMVAGGQQPAAAVPPRAAGGVPARDLSQLRHVPASAAEVGPMSAEAAERLAHVCDDMGLQRPGLYYFRETGEGGLVPAYWSDETDDAGIRTAVKAVRRWLRVGEVPPCHSVCRLVTDPCHPVFNNTWARDTSWPHVEVVAQGARGRPFLGLYTGSLMLGAEENRLASADVTGVASLEASYGVCLPYGGQDLCLVGDRNRSAMACINSADTWGTCTQLRGAPNQPCSCAERARRPLRKNVRFIHFLLKLKEPLELPAYDPPPAQTTAPPPPPGAAAFGHCRVPRGSGAGASGVGREGRRAAAAAAACDGNAAAASSGGASPPPPAAVETVKTSYLPLVAVVATEDPEDGEEWLAEPWYGSPGYYDAVASNSSQFYFVKDMLEANEALRRQVDAADARTRDLERELLQLRQLQEQGQAHGGQQQAEHTSGGHGGAGLERTAFAAAGTSSAAGAATAAADARASVGAAAAVQGPSAQQAAAGPSGAAAAGAPPAEPSPALAERPQEALGADLKQAIEAALLEFERRLVRRELVASLAQRGAEVAQLTTVLAEAHHVAQAEAETARELVVGLVAAAEARAREAERVAADLRERIGTLTTQRDAARVEAEKAGTAAAKVRSERDAARVEVAEQQEAAQRLNERISELEAAADISQKQREDELLGIAAQVAAQVQSALAKKQRQ